MCGIPILFGALFELRGVFYNGSMPAPILATNLYPSASAQGLSSAPDLIERLNEGLQRTPS